MKLILAPVTAIVIALAANLAGAVGYQLPSEPIAPKTREVCEALGKEYRDLYRSRVDAADARRRQNYEAWRSGSIDFKQYNEAYSTFMREILEASEISNAGPGQFPAATCR